MALLKIGDSECYPEGFHRVSELTPGQVAKILCDKCPSVDLGVSNSTPQKMLDDVLSGHKPMFLNKLAIVVSENPLEAVYKHDFGFYLIRK